MSKAHRGSGIRELVNNGRGTCPICKRSGIKVIAGGGQIVLAVFGQIGSHTLEFNPPFPWIDDRQWKGKTALLVSNKPRAWPWFKTVEPIGKIEIPFKKHMKRTIHFNRGIGYRPVDR